jgi:integral membrane protein
MTTASRRRRDQAAGPQRFQAPVRSARPPVWRSLLSGLVLAAVIIGLPAALLATVGPPPLPTGVDVSVLFTQAVSFDVVVGVLVWVLYLAWLQFTVCALVEAASAIKGHGVPGHVPLSGGMQSLVRRLIASVLLLGAVSGPVAAAAAPVVEEPTPAVAVSQDVSSQQPAAADDSQADGAATTSQGADSDHQYMRYMVNGVELDQEIGAQLVGQRVYIVQPPEGRYHDNLWDIAERNLGEGRAYSQIYDLNAGRAQPDGGSLELARLIQPGWLLVMPESATSVARVEAIPTTPAPAPAAPTPQQQQEEGNHIPAGLGQDLRDVAPVQMPAIGSLLAASLVSVLVARRRWLAGAFNEDSAELERLLRVGADESRSRRLDAVLRSLDDLPGSPRPYAVAIDDDACYLRMARPLPDAPAPWRAQQEGMTWALRAGQEPPLKDRPCPLPGLVTVGRTPEGADILIDLAFADGDVIVTGDPAMAAEVVSALALELCTNPWSRDADVVGTGLSATLHGVAGRRLQTPESLMGQAALPGVGGVLTGRRPETQTTFMLIGNGATPPPLPPGRSYALVRTDSNRQGRWTIEIDASGTARIFPLGIMVTASRATEAEIAALEGLFAPVEETHDDGRPPVPDPPMPPLATAALRAASVRIQVLGNTLVETAGAVDQARRSILTEAAVCVSLHPEGIRPSILGAMLWPLGATADVVGATVERLRSWLGQDSQGAPHLREDAEGRLVLGPGVVLDWDVLRSLLDSSRRCAPQQEVELLTEALRLVRGPMVSDAAEGHYTWLARVRAARQFDALVVDAAHRLVELIGDTDPDGAATAIATGLQVVELDQGLWRDRLRLASRRGRGELEQEIRILLDAAGADDLDQIDPATAALVEDLSPGLSVGRRPA